MSDFNHQSLQSDRHLRYYQGEKGRSDRKTLSKRMVNTMNETFGQRFTRLRKQRNLTQEELGERIGLSGQAVSKWENDASMPDISLLVQLSEILGVSLDELLGKEVPATKIVPVEERKNTDDMVLRIRVDSVEGDKVTVNLPIAIVKMGIKLGMTMPQINGNKTLEGIDFEEVIKLVDAGLVGELVTVESAEGDHVRIYVE